MENILAKTEGPVGVITLNRPKALNAFNNALLTELCQMLESFDADPKVRAIVLTGGERVFAAGADIKEMASQSYMDMFKRNTFAEASARIAATRKPVIAAVAGYALGGGCELAMMCDIIIAADSAKFGQPELTLGIIPSMGGTQRLTRLVGRTKAMDMCLTGRQMDAVEAERAGLVSRVVPAASLMAEALAAANKIAALSQPSVMMMKEAINLAEETGLSEGLLFEQRQFDALFATGDQKEGMAAFAEKRQPHFRDK